MWWPVTDENQASVISIIQTITTHLLSIKISLGIFCLMAKSTRWTVRQRAMYFKLVLSMIIFESKLLSWHQIRWKFGRKNLVKNYVNSPCSAHLQNIFFAAKVQNTKMNYSTLFGQNTAVLHTICEVPFIWGHARQKTPDPPLWQSLLRLSITYLSAAFY